MELASLLRAAAHLVGSNKSIPVHDLETVLVIRLNHFYAELDRPQIDFRNVGLEERQLQTAKEALFVVAAVQEIFLAKAVQKDDQNPSIEGSPVVGTRDLSQIRTLLSIVFKWGTDAMLNRLVHNWPNNATQKLQAESKLIDLTQAPEDYKFLSQLTRQLLFIVLPGGHEGPLSQTLIASAVLVKHLTDLLKPSITLGWLPKGLSSDSMPTQDDFRPLVMRLLSLPPTQTIVALGSVMSTSPALPAHVQRSCSFLLSRQLLRPGGVRGLCAAVFGEEEVSEAEVSLEKLQHVSKILMTVPQSMSNQEYFKDLIPQVLTLLSEGSGSSSASYRRAGSFALSRMFAEESSNNSVASCILLPLLHDPILQETPIPEIDSDLLVQAKATFKLTPYAAISTLQLLLINSDPSPTLVSILFTPIASSLYTLYAFMDRSKTSDPALRETLKGLLETWTRIATVQEVIRVFWSIIDGEGGYWKTDIANNIKRVDSPDEIEKLSLFTPSELKRAEEQGDLDIDANLLNLHPDPAHFVGFLKTINRSDLSSELFVKLLESYRDIKVQKDADPLRTLLYLQLIIQMQTKLADTDSSSNILKKPEHILTFIKHSLESVQPTTTTRSADNHRPERQGLGLEDLRIVDVDDSVDSEDSDDETLEEGSIAPDEEMTVTTLNLLLAILESNPSISARNAPVLNDIFIELEPLVRQSSDSVRSLSREARILMTARLASTSTDQNTTSSRKQEEEDTLQVYQKALTLLQDPLLPVRAHGLMLLRQLVLPHGSSGKPSLEPALVPGVLSIFLQSIQDDDSYIFLNAVQGLSAMVDGFGREVLKALMNDYVSGLDGSGGVRLTQTEVDTRVRIGEALGQVIRRFDEALPLYIDILTPPLTRLVRTSYLPTTIRTSSLSLLAQIADTSAIALLPYISDLFNGMIDLLQLETVPRQVQPEKPPKVEERELEPESMDSQPTVANSKFPPLRRAALYFLTRLVRVCIIRMHEMGRDHGMLIPTSSLNRAKTTLSYVGSVDEDTVVTLMAREAREYLDQLSNAVVGL